MEIVVGSKAMKQCDKNTIEHFGIPSLVLMERAALGVVDEMEARGFWQEGNRIGIPGKGTALVVCGLGNNGGDGLAIARILWQRGYSVTVVTPKEPRNVSEETRVQLDIIGRYGIPVISEIPRQVFDVTVDALFGIGLTRDLEGVYKGYIDRMNEGAGRKVAVDIPSGVHADTGEVMGTAFQAELTVTFAFAKSGLLLYPGAGYAGEIVVKDIGISPHSFLGEKPLLYQAGREDLGRIPSRRADSNKGSYGKVLTVAGCRNMAGAAYFSAAASYRTGAGLVKILTEESNRVILQQLIPEAILAVYRATEAFGLEEEGGAAAEGRESYLQELLGWASVVVAGPGLGTGEDAACLVKAVLEYAEVPVILDADGLNLLAGHLEWLEQAKAPVVVTPHLGEMARLTGKVVSDIKKQLVQTAREFAARHNVICVLKDTRTVTACPDQRAYINTSGNPGMATAGSGDVLAGVLAGLVAQGMEPLEAAFVGAYLHGTAADCQIGRVGSYGMMARDVIDGIPLVLSESGHGQDVISMQERLR